MKFRLKSITFLGFLMAMSMGASLFVPGTLAAEPNASDPVITSIDPVLGIIGTEVTIRGNNLGVDCVGHWCSKTVTFGKAYATNLNYKIKSWSDTAIVAEIPDGATSALIEVGYYYDPDGIDSGPAVSYQIQGPNFTVSSLQNKPEVIDISPREGAIGSSLAISGRNLYSGCDGKCGLVEIGFGGEYWQILPGFYPNPFTDGKLVITIPQTAKSGEIILRYTTPDGSYSVKGPWFVVSGTLEHVITGISPTSGGPGTKVTIQGKNFGSRCGGNSCTMSIYFGEGAVHRFSLLPDNIYTWSDDEIVVTVPQEGATTGNIRVAYYNGAISYDISGPRFAVTATPAEEIEKINARARLLKEDRIDTLLAQVNELRNIVKEQATEITHLRKLAAGLQQITAETKERINNFITYGVDDNTKRLGEGERAAVMYSYKDAFSKLPETEAELSDAIKIANGRWPSERSEPAEADAKAEFKRIYKRDANMDNPNDNAAVTVMAYGLRQRAENRKLESEKSGIKIFKGIYGHVPSTTEEWNIMQAITYSGAKR